VFLDLLFIDHLAMALVTILVTLLLIPGSLIAWSAWTLNANLAIARKTEFPLLVRWVTPTNPLWMICGSTIVKTCRALHIGTAHFRRFYLFGWEGNERHIVHQELGPFFLIVSPGGNWLCVSDADAINYVIKHPKDFRRNMEQMEVVNVYGKNLATTDDDEWQRHRKVTGMTFTEKNNELVWRESLVQSKAMLEYWMQHQPVTTLDQDTKVFTLNVLAAALFNKSYPFEGPAEQKASTLQLDDSFKYRNSVAKIISNIIPIFVFGAKGLEAWWTPRSWKVAAEAVSTFRSYITNLINEERHANSRGIQKNQHLVAALVRASEADNPSEGVALSAGRRKATLSEEEIISNLFVFAFAGNDTTAVTLTHLLVHLAAHPQTQDWIAEELRHYLPSSSPVDWDYKVYPNLKRCLAVVVRLVSHSPNTSIYICVIQI
jgi:cytochrome P450